MRPRALVAVLAVVLAVTTCNQSPSASPTSGQPSASGSPAGELRPIRLLLSYRPDVQFAPFYVAQQDGYFERAGLDVTIEHADGGDLIRLVADGQADFGVADATDVMIARTSGIPITYISTLYQSFPVAVIGPSGSVPSDPAGLAGKAIGTPGRYGSSWIALLALLDAGGLTADDVTIREYPQYDQVDGLLNGDVDFITGFRNNEPLRLEAAGMATDQLTIDDIAPLPGPGLIVGDARLETDPALAAAFATAVAEAQAAVIADPEIGLQAAVVEVPTIAEDVDTAHAVLLATVDLWATADSPGVGWIDPELWASGYQTMVDLGFIDGSVPVADMYRAALVFD